MSHFNVKMLQMRIRLGLRHGPHWGAYTYSERKLLVRQQILTCKTAGEKII